VLWAGLLASPTAALLQIGINYAIVPGACWSGREWPLHLVSLLALAAAVGGGLLSRRNWRRAGARWQPDEGGVMPRSSFMAAVGMLVSALSALLIVAQWIAVFVHSTCER
jgi:uncharacterized membrane protein YidH (DUF202 family)